MEQLTGALRFFCGAQVEFDDLQTEVRAGAAANRKNQELWRPEDDAGHGTHKIKVAFDGVDRLTLIGLRPL